MKRVSDTSKARSIKDIYGRGLNKHFDKMNFKGYTFKTEGR